MGANGHNSEVYAGERSGLLRLGNKLVELGFDTETGALVSLLDKRSGCELLRHRDAPRSLLRLMLLDVATREFVALDSADAREVGWQTEATDARAALRMRVAGFPESTVEVETTVALEAGSALSTWRLRVTGVGPGLSAHQCTCPIVVGLMKAGDPAPG